MYPASATGEGKTRDGTCYSRSAKISIVVVVREARADCGGPERRDNDEEERRRGRIRMKGDLASRERPTYTFWFGSGGPKILLHGHQRLFSFLLHRLPAGQAAHQYSSRESESSGNFLLQLMTEFFFPDRVLIGRPK